MRAAVFLLAIVCGIALGAPSAFAWHRHIPAASLPQLRKGPAVATRTTRAFSPEGSGRTLFDLISAAAVRHGVPVRLAHAIIRAESGYRCDARNRSGARGLMQVLPRTARAVGVAGNLLDCATGLEAGLRYLALAVRTGGGGCVGASLYNQGTAAPRVCTAYGRRVLRLAAAP